MINKTNIKRIIIIAIITISAIVLINSYFNLKLKKIDEKVNIKIESYEKTLEEETKETLRLDKEYKLEKQKTIDLIAKLYDINKNNK